MEINTHDRETKAESEAEAETHRQKQQPNFSPIHEANRRPKRLPQPIQLASLCPTMDLAALGLGKKRAAAVAAVTSAAAGGGGAEAGETNSKSQGESLVPLNSINNSAKDGIHCSDSIVVYRTISWQKMFVVNQTDLSNALLNKLILDDGSYTKTKNAKKIGNGTDMGDSKEGEGHDDDERAIGIGSNDDEGEYPNDDDDNDDGIHQQHEPSSVSHLTWSPDGRMLALGLNSGSTLLYDIESSASPGVPPKPVVCIPPPPSQQMTMPMAVSITSSRKQPLTKMQREESKRDEHDINLSLSPQMQHQKPLSSSSSLQRKPMHYSPAVTRSMAAARRKKLTEMIGKSTIASMNTKATADTTSSSTSALKSSKKIVQSNSNSNIHVQSSQYKNTVVSLHWQRFHPIYKDWETFSQYAYSRSKSHADQQYYHQKQQERKNSEESWYFQSYYLDKATHFLPPCAYNSTYPRNNATDMSGYGYNGSGIGIGGGGGHGQDYNSSGGNVGGMGVGGGGGSSRHLSENLDHHSNGFEEITDRYRPKCQTSLSALFAVTAGNGVHLYLQGRYRILSIPPPVFGLFDQSTTITASSDLSNVLLCTKRLDNTNNTPVAATTSGDDEAVTYQNAPILTLYSIPVIAKKRNQLQIISYSYCSIMSHLTTLHEGMKESCSAWSGSLRQLDTKFDQLSNLLTKYGVMPQEVSNTTSNSNSVNDSNMIDKMSIVRRELLNYILGGHSKRSTDTSNAMDQFFTHPLMNDQLLQRLVRSLEANVAGVEGIVRKKILGPVRALMYDVGELHGLVKVMNIESSGYSYGDLDEDEEGELTCEALLMSDHTSLRLYEASEVLFFVTEQCASQLVEIRFRLNCMMKWIRGTASQVKARGTAIDSVQRENARKRRVSEQTVHKIADFLSTTLKSEQKQNNATMVKRGSSECILGILFSDYFCKDKINIESPTSPLKPKTINGCLGKDRDTTIESPSVKTVLEISTQIALDLFDEPRTAMRKSVHQTGIVLDECSDSPDQIVSCVHNRIGAAPNSAPDAKNCFNPNILTNDGSDNNIGESYYFSQTWTIVVNSCSSTKDGQNLLQISALPEYHNNSSALEFDELEHYNYNYTPEQKRSFYITTFVLLPRDCKVSKIKIYGDNGNSTLTSETSSNNQEGRQALGLLLQRNRNSNSASATNDSSGSSSGGGGSASGNVSEVKISEELWLFNYDELDFRAVSLQSPSQDCINDSNNIDNQISIYKFNPAIDPHYVLTTVDDDDDDDGEELDDCGGQKSVVSKWRCVRDDAALNLSSNADLVMSGSRGIGGIICEKSNTIDLFDLEEDEEGDDDDEDSNEE